VKHVKAFLTTVVKALFKFVLYCIFIPVLAVAVIVTAIIRK
jgi:hypothetical protein